ncbi:hypothetical protein DRN75_00580 [Nanoarchaeota archaeon]|nr:MAG: hypothetical protein DRN75_00580 [Nanoarchaeota archaeon]
MKKHKTWVKIKAPKVFNEVDLGETPVYENKDVIGRTVEQSVNHLLGTRAKIGQNVRFKVVNVKGDEAETQIESFFLSRIFAMQIPRRSSKVELVKDLKTKDNVKIRVKMFAITYGRASTTQKKVIRKMMDTQISKIILDMNFEPLILSIISGELQKGIAKSVRKIYPVREVRVYKVERLKIRRKARGKEDQG